MINGGKFPPFVRKIAKSPGQRHRVSLWYGRSNAERIVELAHIRKSPQFAQVTNPAITALALAWLVYD